MNPHLAFARALLRAKGFIHGEPIPHERVVALLAECAAEADRRCQRVHDAAVTMLQAQRTEIKRGVRRVQ